MKKLATLAASSIMFAGAASAEVPQSQYDALYASVTAACSGNFSGCAAALLAARAAIAATPGALSDAQLAGIIGNAAGSFNSAPANLRTSLGPTIGAAIQQASNSIVDNTIRQTTLVVANAVTSGETLPSTVVAQLGSPG